MGIFDTPEYAPLMARYRARIQFRDKLMGGIPQDPKLIEAWLRSKAGITDTEEIRVALLRTMEERGIDVNPDMTFQELEEASKKVAGTRETTGFKRGNHGLYIEARQIKAAFKENTNILYAGDEVFRKHPNNPTKKGARPFMAERVFVAPDQVWLGRNEPDGIEMVIGHVTGPQGPRSTLGYHEYVTGATLVFDVLVTKDAIPKEWWPDLWRQMQENGVGALRSQGHGRFDIIGWEKVDPLSQIEEPEDATADMVEAQKPSTNGHARVETPAEAPALETLVDASPEPEGFSFEAEILRTMQQQVGE